MLLIASKLTIFISTFQLFLRLGFLLNYRSKKKYSLLIKVFYNIILNKRNGEKQKKNSSYSDS